MKKKIISIIIILIILVSSILFYMFNQTKSLINIGLNSTETLKASEETNVISAEYIGEEYEIDSQYGWSYKFISGVTELEVFGFTSNEEDYYRYTASGTYSTISNMEICRITDDSQKGNIGAVYHNVGTYQGKTISLKITVMDWGDIQPYEELIIDGITYQNYPCIGFRTTAIDVSATCSPAISRIQYKLEFVLEETYVDENDYDTITIKGHETIKDMDGSNSSNENYKAEYAEFQDLSEIDKIYVSEDTHLEISESTITGTTDESADDDEQHWAIMLFETDEINFIYSNETWDTIAANQTTATYRTSYHWVLSEKIFATFTNPEIMKTVNGNESDTIEGEEEFEYELEFYVPYEMSDNYYTKFEVVDEISELLDINSITIENDLGEDVTSDFTIDISNSNVITITTDKYTDSDFYNVDYIITIKCNLIDDYDKLSGSIDTNNEIIIPNEATLTTNKGTSKTTEVTVTIEYEPQIGVEKTASITENAKAGDKIIYTMKIENTGKVTLSDVSLTDEITLSSGNSSLTLYTDEDCTEGKEITKISSLAVGESVTVYAIYEVTQDDIDNQIEIINTVTATDGRITGKDTAETQVEDADPQIDVEKTASITEDAKVGDEIIYTIKIENTGNIKLADVEVSDIITISSEEKELTLYSDEDCTEGNEVTIIEEMKLEEIVTLYTKYTVTQDDLDSQTVIKNTVTVTFGGRTETATAITITEGSNIDFTVSKTADILEDAEAGDEITYTINIKNNGNTTLLEVTLKDIISNGSGEEELTLYTDKKCTEGNEISVIKTLEVGETVKVYAKYVVTENDMSKVDSIVNTITATMGETSVKDKVETLLSEEDNQATSILPYTGGEEPRAVVKTGLIAIIVGFVISKIKIIRIP